MIEISRPSLIKPTISTPFHIDFSWWKDNDNNWRIYLYECLCDEHREIYKDTENIQIIDWVDPETAEITQVDGIQHILITHCALQPDFLTETTTLVDAVFRVLLASGNNPLTILELSDKIGKPANTILRTLSGPKVYLGLRPVLVKP